MTCATYCLQRENVQVLLKIFFDICVLDLFDAVDQHFAPYFSSSQFLHDNRRCDGWQFCQLGQEVFKGVGVVFLEE